MALSRKNTPSILQEAVLAYSPSSMAEFLGCQKHMVDNIFSSLTPLPVYLGIC